MTSGVEDMASPVAELSLPLRIMLQGTVSANMGSEYGPAAISYGGWLTSNTLIWAIRESVLL